MKRLVWLMLSGIILLASCKETTKPPTTLVNALAVPSGDHSSLPYLFSDGEKLVMSWVESVGDSLSKLSYATLHNGQWDTPQKIVSGKDWFVNWADFPAIAENKGHLLSHVLKKSSSGTYSYDVKLNLKRKGEEQWKTNLPLHTDNTPTEHGFVTALPYGEGFFTTWLDGRNTIADSTGVREAMTIRAAAVSFDGSITNEVALDIRTCDCCQTTAVITENGPVVVYRDRSEAEVRDISLVRKVAGEWSAPKSIHNDGWKIKGCPVNGPKADAIGNQLAIAWFTAANDFPKVNLIFSGDGGATFDAPIRVDEANAMGRVDVVLLDKDTAVVSWMETSEGQAVIKAVLINRDGTRGEMIIITELDASRKTGFPQMELVGDTLYFAWTDVDGATTKLRMATVFAASF